MRLLQLVAFSIFKEKLDFALLIPSLKNVFSVLDAQEKRRYIYIILLMAFSAVADAAGVLSIMPFLIVLSDPGFIQENPLLSYVYTFLGFDGVIDFYIFLGLALGGVFFFSIVIKVIANYLSLVFVLTREHALGLRLIRAYIGKPYYWYLDKNGSDLGKNVLSQVQDIVHQTFLPLTLLIANGLTAIVLIIALLLVDITATLIVAAFFGCIYSMVYRFFRNKLTRYGSTRIEANSARFGAVSEAFGAIRELKLSGSEEQAIEKFSRPSESYALVGAKARVTGVMPRYIFEALAFSALLGVILVSLLSSGDITGLVPVIGVYAFAGYRLMPALQQIYMNMSNLKFSAESLEMIKSDLALGKESYFDKQQPHKLDVLDVEFVNVSFKYPGEDSLAISGLNLKIKKGQKVGVVGYTGSGKSTMLDLFANLLAPDSGELRVNGESLTKQNTRQYRSSIGYVPQDVFLSDGSVLENICFGMPSDSFDRALAEKCARGAQIHDKILQLKDGYNSIVGERGMKLSGGQKQRLGIARALYRKPSILILDEATSALDNVTEARIMESINGFDENMTIVSIAHRLTTIEKCETIFVLNNGKIEAEGSYSKLLASNKMFRDLAHCNDV